MSDVTVTIRRRAYRLGCPNGQEQRIRELAILLNERADALAAAGAPLDRAPESTALVMLALSLADELDQRPAAEETAATPFDPTLAERMAALLASAAERVEDLAVRIEPKR